MTDDGDQKTTADRRVVEQTDRVRIARDAESLVIEGPGAGFFTAEGAKLAAGTLLAIPALFWTFGFLLFVVLSSLTGGLRDVAGSFEPTHAALILVSGAYLIWWGRQLLEVVATRVVEIGPDEVTESWRIFFQVGTRSRYPRPSFREFDESGDRVRMRFADGDIDFGGDLPDETVEWIRAHVRDYLEEGA